jgi:DNA-binding Lrp family transcriptional regulator
LDERDAKVLAILREATHPLYQKEVAERADLTQWAAGRSLRYMTAAGTIFRRTETSDERPEGTGGRFHYLYWPERQIPKRDPALYAVSNRLIDRIYRLQPGESLATRWFSSGILAEVDELVNAGVLTKTDPGTDDERIQLAEESNVTDVESVVEETTPEPVPTAQDFLSGMVDAAVSVAGRFQDAISKADPAELEREVSVPELSPQTPEETRVLLGGKTDAELAGEAQTGVYDIAVHIQRLIGQHVADATRGYQADREAAVEETQLLRRRLATAEEKLAAAERERDEIKAKYDRVREAFGS